MVSTLFRQKYTMSGGQLFSFVVLSRLAVVLVLITSTVVVVLYHQ